MSIQDMGSLTAKVNRVEVINHTKGGEGREYVWWPEGGEYDVKIHIQDEGRTLKVLISDPLTQSAQDEK